MLRTPRVWSSALAVLCTLSLNSKLTMRETPMSSSQTVRASSNTPADVAAPEVDTTERNQIAGAILTIAREADRRDWDAVASAFADTVTLDYGTPEQLTPREIVERWQPLLEAFDITAHTIDEITYERTGNRATTKSRFVATHTLIDAGGDGDVWTLEGRYEHQLQQDSNGRWHVTSMRMIPSASTGNAGLLALAQARASSRAAARAAEPASEGFHAVRVERVTFASDGERMVGNLYLPQDVSSKDRLPAVIVTGAWMTVKEQMAGRYARELARRGYAALAFDFRHWGESGGLPRQLEHPVHKMADIRAAAAFLSTRTEVDANRISGLGICASSGYMANAVAADPLFQAVAFVAPWLHDTQIVEEVYGGREGVASLIEVSRQAARQYTESGQQQLVRAASLTDSSALMFGAPYYTEADRGMIPAWRNQADVAMWEAWLTFDAVAAAPRLTLPTLLVHSEAAAIPQGAHRFFANLAAKDKAERWLENVTQFDFYDSEAAVTAASDAVAAHFALLRGDALSERDPHADVRSRNRIVIERFFSALEAKDVDAFLDVWAEDGVQLMPFSPLGFPTRLDGKATIRNQYAALPENYLFMRFPREIMPMQDPERFVVRYTGQIGLKSGGRYDNTYLGLFTVRAGRIAEFVEFFNPSVLEEAFGSALLTNFNAARR